MQYPRFALCIELLNTPIEHLSPGHPEENPLLGTAGVISEFYIELFTIELEEELERKHTREQMENLIRLFVSRLIKSKNHRSIKEILPDIEVNDPPKELKSNPRSNRNNEWIFDTGIPITRVHEQQFSRGCNILYHLIFDELQRCCVTFKIPFLRLCEELNFDIATINVEYSVKNGQKEISPEIENSREVTIQPQITVLSDLDMKRELQQIRNSENQFWRGLSMEFVINHFSVFTSKKSRNENVFLTNEQFISFLKRGFLKDTTQPVQKINCSSREKGMIIKTFYQFYDVAVGQYACPHTKVHFISLFTDCFNNWDPSTVKDFFRQGKVNKQL